MVNNSSSGHFYEHFDSDAKLRSIHKACLNESLINKLGRMPLKYSLRRVGGWPVLEQEEWNNTWWLASKQNYSWYKQVLNLEKEGLFGASNAILSYDVIKDPNDDSKFMLTLQRAHAVRYQHINLENMVYASNLLGVPKKQAEIELNEALSFAIALRKLWFKDAFENNNKFAYVTLDEIHKAFNLSIGETLPGHPPDWKEFFQQWLHDTDVIIKKDQLIILKDIDYIINLSKLFEKFKHKTRAIANFLIWLVVAEEESLKHFFEFKYNLQGGTRWMACIHYVGFETGDIFLGPAAGSLYVRGKQLEKMSSHKQKLSKIVRNLRGAMNKMFRQAQWMDNQTRQNAEEKLDHMTSLVAYPKEITNKTFMEQYFKG